MSSDEMEIDQSLAQRLLIEGGTLVLLNVPPGTDFGIDIKSWNTGENFKGVKMIPPGFHYIHYGAVDEFDETAPRVGFFHIFKQREFLVRQWDPKEEEISVKSVPEQTIDRLKQNLKNLDKYLGPYPYDKWKDWKALTSQIDASLVERCSPLCGYVRSALELESLNDASRPRGSTDSTAKQRSCRLTEDKEEQLLPDLKPVPGTDLRFSKLPRKHYPEGATPTEITKHSLDSSYALNTVLETLTNPMEIIGELQLAFVCFLAGQSFDAFEQWKKLISLICGADSVIPLRRAVYMEFLKTLQVQLSYVPEDVLCDIVAGKNFVYLNLRKLFGNIECNPEIDGRLKSYAARFRDQLTSKFFWDFSGLQDEADDEAPVIVRLE